MGPGPGTFFRYYRKEGERLSVKCPLCSEVCTLSHLQGHLSERYPINGEEDDVIDYLVRLAKKADPGSSLLPLPIQDSECPGWSAETVDPQKG